VVERAKEVLEGLEERNLSRRIKKGNGAQLSLFSASVQSPSGEAEVLSLQAAADDSRKERELLKAIEEIDLNRLSGLEALNLLAKWKESKIDEKKPI